MNISFSNFTKWIQIMMLKHGSSLSSLLHLHGLAVRIFYVESRVWTWVTTFPPASCVFIWELVATRPIAKLKNMDHPIKIGWSSYATMWLRDCSQFTCQITTADFLISSQDDSIFNFGRGKFEYVCILRYFVFGGLICLRFDL